MKLPVICVLFTFPTGLRKTKLAGVANTTFVLLELSSFLTSGSRCAF